jgi:cell division protein FtsW
MPVGHVASLEPDACLRFAEDWASQVTSRYGPPMLPRAGALHTGAQQGAQPSRPPREHGRKGQGDGVLRGLLPRVLRPNRLRDDAAPAPEPASAPAPWVRRTIAGPADAVLASMVTAVMGLGVVMVYSASAIEATGRNNPDPTFFLRRQAGFALFSLFMMWLVSRIDFQWVRRSATILLLAAAGLMAATVVGLGHRAGNAYRWIRVGSLQIQPAEFAKVAIVFWLAYALAKKREKMTTFFVGILPHVLVVGVFVGLCLLQPDFGSSAVISIIAVVLLFIAGARLRHLLVLGALGGVAGYWLAQSRQYRLHRLLAWADMEANRNGIAYQPYQSVLSFGSGGASGQGLGKGLQVLYLPEAHTDFISAILGEELGFVGVLGLCAAYAIIVARGVRIALRARDDFASFSAFGISILFGFQVVTNLGVAMALLPTKGLTLPFMSYGGSSLLVNALAVGVLLSISRTWREVPKAESLRGREPLALAPSAATTIALSNDGGKW